MASSSSSSAAAAGPRLPKHDVFLSFSGKDTRTKFTSHLYTKLSEKQIKAYIDEVSLEKGDTISPALLEAIEESEISIIIFSPNYASSSWCLDELVHILKCKKEKARIVLPIFIDIDPSHIRKQEGSYAAAFEKHEKRFKSEKVREWRQALTEAAGLSGWDSEKKSESKILEEVVEHVKRELDTINSKGGDDFKGLVGILKRLEKIKSFLDSPTVRVVGIWGMGGIGKTTLAKAVYDRFHIDFEGSYFAPNVRENALKKGFDTFEKEVYSELLGDKNLDTFKSSAVNHRLSRTKALLVLDDVESPKQFEDLVGDRDRFCLGSKIIVTSRNKLKVDEEYKVEELVSNDACKLFYLNAFGHESCRRGFEEISDRVVEYTKGHPLALKVLGASVFYFLESIEDWRKELKKLKRIPNNEIHVSLERSYDVLDDEEKGLFLDIACFFKGVGRDIVVGMLEDKPITGLVRKSLITIEDDKIQMHDLIQEMGRNIVLRSTGKLGERSRLWIPEDVFDVLENNKGTEAIEGIYLPWNKEDKELHLRPDVFEEMRTLRFLKFYDACLFSFLEYPKTQKVKVYIEGDLKYLPNGLRYLHWEHYPGKSLPSNFNPQNLVELDMRNSKLEQLWDGVQELRSLKHINLSKSRLLTKIPDLSRAPRLESINLSCCSSLIHIPSLNINLQATVDKSAYNHRWISGYEDKLEVERTPGCIILHGCLGLTTLPKVSANIRELVLSGTALKELPSSIESLENLLFLDLGYCNNLKSLPKLPRNIEVLLLDFSGIEQIPSSSIECLFCLRKLSLANCQRLKSLPSNINLKALEELVLLGTSIQELPSTIENSKRLRRLFLNWCLRLEFIPEILCKLTRLKEISLANCSKIESFTVSNGLFSLTQLNLAYCNIRELPAFDRIYNVKILVIQGCKNLQSLPASIGMLYKLKILNMSYCENLQSLPASIGMLYKLKYLDINHCKNLRSLPASIGTLYKLKWLHMNNCKNLRSLPASIGMLYKLKTLDISNCNNLQSLPELPLFIESVNAEGCSSLEMVSTLRSTLTLGRWRDKYDSRAYKRKYLWQGRFSSVRSQLSTIEMSERTFARKFSFINCRNLGEDAINNIFTEFLYKVFCTATTPKIMAQKVIGDLVVCYSTKEIPRWFNNQSEGSSITITLPPNWYNPKTFLGFVVSVVVVSKGEYVSLGSSGLEGLGCKLRLKTNCGESLEKVQTVRTNFKRYVPYSSDSSDHMFVWYKYFDHSKANFEKYQEASFEFYSKGKVLKRCGVRMLYLKDVVEESDDGTTYDSDEPPPKRTRN